VILPASHYVERGNNFISMGRYKDAEDAFEIVMSGDPRNIDGIIGLGMVKFFLGSYTFASSKFDEAIKLDARNVPAWTYKAVSQANAENLEGAIKSIDKAITYDSSDSMALYYGAAIYAESGDMEKAEELIGKALEIDPDNTYIRKLADEINPGISSSGDTTIKETEKYESESDSTITDLTKDMQSMVYLYGVGDIISAEREEKGTQTIIRLTVRDNKNLVTPVDYNVVLKVDPVEGSAPLEVKFTDESFATGGVTPIKWIWKIDGDSFNKRDLTHTFYIPGTYTINWEIRWSDGMVLTSTDNTAIHVNVNGSDTNDTSNSEEGTGTL
jgi:tetratricopeptide (TPR) repeat protein